MRRFPIPAKAGSTLGAFCWHGCADYTLHYEKKVSGTALLCPQANLLVDPGGNQVMLRLEQGELEAEIALDRQGIVAVTPQITLNEQLALSFGPQFDLTFSSLHYCTGWEALATASEIANVKLRYEDCLSGRVRENPQCSRTQRNIAWIVIIMWIKEEVDARGTPPEPGWPERLTQWLETYRDPTVPAWTAPPTPWQGQTPPYLITGMNQQFGAFFTTASTIGVLTLDDRQKQPGEALTFSGYGFAPGGRVDVTLCQAESLGYRCVDSGGQVVDQLGAALALTADTEGEIEGTWVLPASMMSGDWLLVAVDVSKLYTEVEAFADDPEDAPSFYLAAEMVQVAEQVYLPAIDGP
jgi:hypothetical protein